MDSSSTKTKISRSRKTNNKSSNKKQHDSIGKQVNKKQQDDAGGCLKSFWICKNASCRANVSKAESFCKRCSCSVCHKFDENKDPSLWLVCEPEKADDVEFCGLSCHLECAFRENKVGVTTLGNNLMKLDGCFCCYSCGKVSEILGCWKKQLMVAKEARRRDVLCSRIELSYRLLNGTSRFSELHEIVRTAKSMLEAEVGPLDKPSARTDRGIVSRLPVAALVQDLCASAIKKAELSANAARDLVPAACRFHFEDIGPTQVTLRLIELPSAAEYDVKGYKLWYFKKGETPEDDLFIDCGRTERRMIISDLDPCTEYTFRVISQTEAGLFGHSNARCFTESVEMLPKSRGNLVDRKEKRITDLVGDDDQPLEQEKKSIISSGFHIGELAQYVQLAEAQEEGLLESFYNVDTEKSCEPEEEEPEEDPMEEPEEDPMEEPEDELPSRRPHRFDLNRVSVPDLNEEFTPLPDFSGGEDNGVPLESLAEAIDNAGDNSDDADDNYDDAVSNGRQKKENNCLVRSDGSGDDPEFDFLMTRKRKADSNSNESENHECDSSSIDHTLEKCAKVIRWLERGGHIDKTFRVRFLTWFSLNSSAQEQSVVNTFVQMLEDDPSSLAGQLLDAFAEVVSTTRPNNGFCRDKLLE